MVKKVLWGLGPLLVACILVGCIFFSPIPIRNANDEMLDKAASSMSREMIKGNFIKNSALQHEKYVPFFGSSELSRISAFHPSALAEKYQRGYEPFLLGAPGSQSLTHYAMLQSFGDSIDNRKVVFVISPQWFVREGVTASYYNAYFSPQQTYQWLSKLDDISPSEQYYAKRLLAYPVVRHHDITADLLRQIADKRKLSKRQLDFVMLAKRFYDREDELFSKWDILSRQDQIHHAAKRLPREYNFDELDILAYHIGEERVGNTPFGLDRSFYRKRVEPELNKLKGSQKNFDYRFSPEYSDFELVLETLAEHHMDALFIIPPVNKAWSEYTGLSQTMMEQCGKKLEYQLKSQGFHHIANFIDKNDEPYFMQDTIHLGWRGWLACDQYIQPFLMEKQPTPTYHINPYFYSHEWAYKKLGKI